jgi:NTE family protein
MQNAKHKIGIALGGGGVRGLAHITVLEAIDQAGIQPAILSGTSMGAIIAALYASGKSGKDIRQLIEKHMVTREDKLKTVYAKKDFLFAWREAVKLSWKTSGIFKTDGFLRHLIEQMNAETFEDLKIPLQVVATDFHSSESVVLQKGPLLPALKASTCVPGVFEPIQHEGHVLFDGGVSNNLPYDLLQDKCDLVIAVDVSSTRRTQKDEMPNMIEATVAMFDTLMNRVTQIKLDQNPPDLYFHPEICGIRMLEFHKIEEVFKQAESSMPDIRRRLQAMLTNDDKRKDVQ